MLSFLAPHGCASAASPANIGFIDDVIARGQGGMNLLSTQPAFSDRLRRRSSLDLNVILGTP